MSLQSIFELYLTNRDNSYLTPLLFKADDLAHQAASLQLLTIPCFGIVGSLELAILQEVHLVRKKPGDKKAIAVKAAALIKDSSVFRPALEAYNQTRFSPVDSITRWNVSEPDMMKCGYTVDGQYWPEGAQENWDHDQAVAQRQKHIAREFARLENIVLGPLYAVLDKWRKIAL